MLRLLSRSLPYKRPLGRYVRQVCGGTTTGRDVLLAWQYLFSRQLCEGSSISLYERAFAEYVGTRYACSFGAGRVALYAILQSLGVKDGDEVILPGYTCVVVPQAIRYCGANPVYADISTSTYNVTLAEVERKLTSRSRVVIVQHTYGIPADILEIVDWAHSKGLQVIEDCAPALGATYNGRQVGTFGDAAFFSSEHSKVISTGRGGVAVTNSSNLAEKLRAIQSGCRVPAKMITRKLLIEFILLGTLGNPSLMSFGYVASFLLRRLIGVPKSTTEQEMAGHKPVNYEMRLSNAQAAIGLSQLRNLEANLAHRRTVARFYSEQLSSFGVPRYVTAVSRPTFVRYPVQVSHKDSLVHRARNLGVGLGVWFTSPIHPAGSSLEAAHYKLGSCPRAEEAVEHTVNLSTHQRTTMDDAERAVKIVRSALGSTSK